MELETTVALTLRDMGRELGQRLIGGMVIILRGDLGAGKTSFAQGVAEGLGVSLPVTSPTFALIQLYEGRHLNLVHCDFYRLKSPQEALDIGFLEYQTARNVVLVEWGDAFRELMPGDVLTLDMIYTEAGRKIHLEQVASKYQAIIDEWVQACQSSVSTPRPR